MIASFAALGDIAIAEPGALLSFAGPRVVQQTTRETLPDDFGLAESQLRLGHIDAVVPRGELTGEIARLLALFAPAPEETGEFELPEPEAAGAFGWLRRLLGRGSDG